MKKKNDPIKKYDPIMETCEDGDAPDAIEWLEGSNVVLDNEKNVEAFGYTSEISTREAKISHKNVSNKSSKRAKRSCGGSSSRGIKFALPPIDEKNDEIVESDKEFLASDDSETEESEHDIVLDDI